MSRFQHSNNLADTGTRWARNRHQQFISSLNEEAVELVRGMPTNEPALSAGLRRLRESGVNTFRSLRLKQLLSVQRGNNGTVYDGPFDLEDEISLRLYARWFRVNYPAPKDLVALSDDFLGHKLDP